MSVFYNFTKGIALTVLFCCFSMISFSQTCVEDAPVVACGDVVTGNTQGGTPDSTLPFCGTSLTSAPGHWYIFEGNGDTINITASTAGSSYDTKLGVFTGSCASLTCVGGNDDFGGLTSRVVFETVPNQNYYIYVTGYSSNAGEYTLTVTCNVQASVDSDCYIVYNGYAGCTDIMASASYGTPPYTFSWSDGSEGESINVCPTENTDYTVTVTDANGGTATAVAKVVYVPQDISCGRNKVQICHRDGKFRGRTICVARSAVAAHLAHGDSLGSCEETYYTCSTPPSCAMITSPMDGAVDVSMPVTLEWEGAMGLLDGYWVSVGTTMGGNDVVDSAEGGLDLMHTINGLDFETTYYVSVTPYNGNGMAEGCEGISFTTQMNPCNMAPAIACDETASGSTAGGLVFNVGTCGTSLNTAPGVWYAFTGTGDIVTVDTNGSSYDTKLGVFTGTCDELVCLDGDDDGGDSVQSLVTFTSEEGVDYLIYVTGFSSNAGDYVLNVTCEEPASAIEITCGVPYNETYCYTANDNSTFAYTNNGAGPLTIEFNAGYIESATYDHLRIYDGTDATGTLLWENVGGTINNLDGTIATSASGNLFMTITSDGSVQCVGSSSATRTWDFDVYCGEPEVSCYSAGDATLDIDFDFYASETSWDVQESGGGIIASGSGYSNGASPISVSIPLTAGDFTLNIYDSYGDGIFCSSGLVVLTDSSGETIASFCGDINQGASASFDFCVDASGKFAVSKKEVAAQEILNWSMAPNPTRGDVTLNLSNYLRSNVTVEVIDFTGKVISSQSVRDLQTARYKLELNSSLPSGMYFVRVAADSQVSSKKLVIMR